MPVASFQLHISCLDFNSFVIFSFAIQRETDFSDFLFFIFIYTLYIKYWMKQRKWEKQSYRSDKYSWKERTIELNVHNLFNMMVLFRIFVELRVMVHVYELYDGMQMRDIFLLRFLFFFIRQINSFAFVCFIPISPSVFGQIVLMLL